MRIEDRLSQLERLVEKVAVLATAVPVSALPSGFWGRVSDTHFVTRSTTEEFGDYNLRSVHFDGTAWLAHDELNNDLTCQIVLYYDVPAGARRA